MRTGNLFYNDKSAYYENIKTITVFDINNTSLEDGEYVIDMEHFKAISDEQGPEFMEFSKLVSEWLLPFPYLLIGTTISINSRLITDSETVDYVCQTISFQSTNEKVCYFERYYIRNDIPLTPYFLPKNVNKNQIFTQIATNGTFLSNETPWETTGTLKDTWRELSSENPLIKYYAFNGERHYPPTPEKLIFTLNPYTEDSYGVGPLDKSISGSVVIPATYQGLPVTSVNAEFSTTNFNDCINITRLEVPGSIESFSYAFQNCSSLTDVILHEGITILATHTFKDCISLKNIIIPSTLEQITDRVFENCSSLETIELNEGLHTISDVFINCENLKAIHFPSSVLSLYIPFSSCYSLSEVTIDEGNTYYKSFENSIYNKDITELVLCVPENENSIYIMPETVTSVREQAFSLKPFKGIIISSNYNYIEMGHFSTGNIEFINFRDLTPTIESISINPKKIYTVHTKVNPPSEWEYLLLNNNTFNEIPWINPFGSDGLEYTLNEDNISYSCSGIGTSTEIDIIVAVEHNGLPVTKISAEAFMNNYDLNTVELPYTITEIGADAFSTCENLISINIPYGVTNIADRTFYACGKLGKISLPNTVKEIGEDSFNNCISLHTIEGLSKVETIKYQAFVYCIALTEVNLSDSIINISYAAFNLCENLLNVYSDYTKDNCPVTWERNLNDELFNATWFTGGIKGTEGLVYTLVGNEYKCTGIGTADKNGDIIIGNIYNGLPVTSIGERAFSDIGGSLYEDRKANINIYISEGIKSIEAGAFQGNYLNSLTIANSVTIIDTTAFTDSQYVWTSTDIDTIYTDYTKDSYPIEWQSNSYWWNSDNPLSLFDFKWLPLSKSPVEV